MARGLLWILASLLEFLLSNNLHKCSVSHRELLLNVATKEDVTKLDNRITHLESAVTKLDNRMTNLEGAMAKLETRVSSIEEILVKIAKSLAPNSFGIQRTLRGISRRKA